jgi:hypothetical protein
VKEQESTTIPAKPKTKIKKKEINHVSAMDTTNGNQTKPPSGSLEAAGK